MSSDKEDLCDGPNYSNMLFVTTPLVRVHLIMAKRIIKQYGKPEQHVKYGKMFCKSHTCLWQDRGELASGLSNFSDLW